METQLRYFDKWMVFCFGGSLTEEFASLRFSVAEECFRNAVGAGTAFSSLTTSDELNLSRYIA